MRISDWSSDVCSSDLRAFQRTVIETQRTQQIFAVPRLDDGLVAEQKRALGLLQHRGNAIDRPVRIERQYHAAKQTSHHLQQLHEILHYELRPANQIFRPAEQIQENGRATDCTPVTNT